MWLRQYHIQWLPEISLPLILSLWSFQVCFKYAQLPHPDQPKGLAIQHGYRISTLSYS